MWLRVIRGIRCLGRSCALLAGGMVILTDYHRSELESKVVTLAHYAGLTDLAPVKAIMKRVAGLESESNVLGFQF